MKAALASLLLVVAAACAREEAEPTVQPAQLVAAPNLEVNEITFAAAPQSRAIGSVLIRNSGGAPDRLLSAASPIAQRIDIYETRQKPDGTPETYFINGGVPLPADAERRLGPGGPHLVAVGLAAPLTPGQRVPITLVFERTGAIQFEAIVAPAG